MRKVKFKKYNHTVFGEKTGLGDSRTVIKKAGWDEDFIHEGVFHQWGVAFEDSGESYGNYSVALIEDENGLIHEIIPSNIKFESN